jgi:hypothetical protein
MGLVFWKRPPRDRIDSSYANIVSRPHPPMLWDRDRHPPTNYDIRVRGLDEDSLYWLEGSWSLGRGCQ